MINFSPYIGTDIIPFRLCELTTICWRSYCAIYATELSIYECSKLKYWKLKCMENDCDIQLLFPGVIWNENDENVSQF